MMNRIDNIDEVEFHDSVITSISQEESKITLEVEYVSQDEDLVDGTLEINGVEEILRDDDIVHVFATETDSGPQIIDLKRNQGEIRFLLEWNTFNPNRTYINTYAFLGKNMSASFLITRRRDDEDMDTSP